MLCITREANETNSFVCLVETVKVKNIIRPNIPEYVPFETLEHADQRQDGMTKIRVWAFPETIPQ